MVVVVAAVVVAAVVVATAVMTVLELNHQSFAA